MYENNQNKNSVFVDLFQNCDDALKNDLELIRWLKLLPDDWDGEIKLLHLDDTLYKAFKNDVSFLVGDIILILAEHQSTINPNMPFRALLYIARLLEKFVKVEDRYKRKLAKIPSPAIYVFYNGETEMPFIHRERLSTAFLVGEDFISRELKAVSKDKVMHREYRPDDSDVGDYGRVDTDTSYPLELVVTIININKQINGRDNELLKECPILYEYSQLIQMIRDMKEAGVTDYFSKAINECINAGILADYLSERRSEVYNMLIAEYDYDTDMRVNREEAWEDGLEEGILQERLNYIRRKLAKKVSEEALIDDLMDSFGITESEAVRDIEEAKKTI
ncbi:MAG: Rpn family recombination-promoting nuclease/putative transposase [Eubacterium sp.]|nr:Rpn family recombination-promoting nuclease/putative transposase [Eubacterium sp.]